MQDFKITPLSNFNDALEVKNIRNECRNFMTNDSSTINFVSQLRWYFRIYKRKNRNGQMFCYLIKKDRKTLGFGLIRKEGDKFWITGGLITSQRGKGLGEQLFTYLIENTPSSQVWLEVLNSNKVALILYKKLGFKETERKLVKNKKIVVMKLNK